jgi:hypothetical protein
LTANSIGVIAWLKYPVLINGSVPCQLSSRYKRMGKRKGKIQGVGTMISSPA